MVKKKTGQLIENINCCSSPQEAAVIGLVCSTKCLTCAEVIILMVQFSCNNSC